MQFFNNLIQRSNRQSLSSSVLLAILLMALVGCAGTHSASAPQASVQDSIALLPIMNLTETPQAGARAETLVEALLKARGFNNLKRFNGNASSDALFQNGDSEAVKQAAAAASADHMKYGLTGSVVEWRYKVGVDGEPAVGISLKLINLETNEIVWAGSGSRTGWSRNAVSGEAQKLIEQLLGKLAL